MNIDRTHLFVMRREPVPMTLRDGSNVKYLIKSEKIDPSNVTAQEGRSKGLVSKWELSGLGTALSTGDSALPNDIALKISN